MFNGNKSQTQNKKNPLENSFITSTSFEKLGQDLAGNILPKRVNVLIVLKTIIKYVSEKLYILNSYKLNTFSLCSLSVLLFIDLAVIYNKKKVKHEFAIKRRVSK